MNKEKLMIRLLLENDYEVIKIDNNLKINVPHIDSWFSTEYETGIRDGFLHNPKNWCSCGSWPSWERQVQPYLRLSILTWENLGFLEDDFCWQFSGWRATFGSSFIVCVITSSSNYLSKFIFGMKTIVFL